MGSGFPRLETPFGLFFGGVSLFEGKKQGIGIVDIPVPDNRGFVNQIFWVAGFLNRGRHVSVLQRLVPRT